MSKSVPWIIALAAVLILGGGWLHALHDRQRDDQQTQRRLAALEQATSAGARTTAAGAAQSFDANARAAFAARASGRMDAAAATPMDAPSEAERKRQQAQDRARLEARFATDGSDPRWAQGTEAAATRAIAEPALAPFGQPAGSAMQCARTMCRMTFTFDSASAAADWAMYYPVSLAGQLPVIQSQQTRLADGSVQLVVYGFRDPKAKPLQ